METTRHLLHLAGLACRGSSRALIGIQACRLTYWLTLNRLFCSYWCPPAAMLGGSPTLGKPNAAVFQPDNPDHCNTLLPLTSNLKTVSI